MMAPLTPAGLATVAIVFVALIKTSSADDSNERTVSSSMEEERIVFQTPAPPVASRRCYVCGPRAAQPHRSRRPPTCQGFTEPGGLVEDCDHGYNFCAIVITMDPYMESRLCVRKHDTDCKTKECNTTNKMVITCSCQGDLCNGNKTQRVDNAVAMVATTNVAPRKERQVKTEQPNNTDTRMSTALKGDPMPTVATANLIMGTSSVLPPTSTPNDTKEVNIHQHEKDTTELMSDDPHDRTHKLATSGKATTNHVPHGTAFDYDEESEDDDEGSGRSADVEQQNGKRQQSSEGKPLDADKRQATSTVITTDAPNGATLMQPFFYTIMWTITAFILT